MTELSIMVEGQDGVNWANWRAVVSNTEALGFAGLYRSDHYTNPQPPEKDALEMIVSLTELALSTKRIHFGPLVAPFSFREPTMMARQAAAIDDLSEGRMWLGLGAGWQDREHNMFGHRLGTMKERMDRFEEGVKVTSLLLNSDEPVNFSGQYYNLRDAIMLPRPQRPGGPPILIGGMGRTRTMPLVAKYASHWNAVSMSPAEYKDLSAFLDGLLKAEGRQPGEVKRSYVSPVIFGRTKEELEKHLNQPPFNAPEIADKSLDKKLAWWRDERYAFVGNGEEIAAQMKTYSDASAEEIMTHWFHLDDMEGLQHYAEDVLPRLQ